MAKKKGRESVDETLNDLDIPQEESVEQKVALELNDKNSGVIVEQKKGEAIVELETNDTMTLDNQGLISPGAIFHSASYAALLAVNDPNGVCIGSDIKFLAPLESGNLVRFHAKALQSDIKKIEVKVTGEVLEIKVFEGIFYLVIFEKHILRIKLSKRQKEVSNES